MNPKRQAAGRKGGLKTLALHGRVHFIKNGMLYGRLGGRPRNPMLADVKAPKIDEGGRLHTGLRELREALGHKSNLFEGGLRLSRGHEIYG